MNQGSVRDLQIFGTTWGFLNIRGMGFMITRIATKKKQLFILLVRVGWWTRSCDLVHLWQLHMYWSMISMCIIIYMYILIEAVPCSAPVSRKVFLLNRMPSSFHGLSSSSVYSHGNFEDPIQMLKRLGPPSDVKRCFGKNPSNHSLVTTNWLNPTLDGFND